MEYIHTSGKTLLFSWYPLNSFPTVFLLPLWNQCFLDSPSLLYQEKYWHHPLEYIHLSEGHVQRSPGGLEKEREGKGRLRRGKREGRRARPLVPYPVWELWPVVRRRRPGDQGQKGPSCRSWLWSIGGQAGPWVPRVVRMSDAAKRSPRQSRHLLQEDRPIPGPERGLLPNTQKWMSEETHVLTEQEILLGRGTQAESRRVREPRRTALPRGLQSEVLGWRD